MTNIDPEDMSFLLRENSELLKEMEAAGMNLSVAHDVDFFHNFTKKKDAERMQRELDGSDVVQFTLEENESNDGWVLCVTVHLLLSADAISRLELTFDEIAEKHHGESDGWGVLQA